MNENSNKNVAAGKEEDRGWAMEILHDYKVANKRMFLAFLISVLLTVAILVAVFVVVLRGIDSLNKFTEVISEFEYGIYSEAEQYGDGTNYNLVGPEGGVTFESDRQNNNSQEPGQ